MSSAESGHGGVDITQKNALVEGLGGLITILPSITHILLQVASNPTMQYMINSKNNWKGPAH
jgi:hypothetical protein